MPPLPEDARRRAAARVRLQLVVGDGIVWRVLQVTRERVDLFMASRLGQLLQRGARDERLIATCGSWRRGREALVRDEDG